MADPGRLQNEDCIEACDKPIKLTALCSTPPTGQESHRREDIKDVPVDKVFQMIGGAQPHLTSLSRETPHLPLKTPSVSSPTPRSL